MTNMDQEQRDAVGHAAPIGAQSYAFAGAECAPPATAASDATAAANTTIATTTTTTPAATARKIDERIKLHEVNSYLTCLLCKGYLIDATTISECLHSFCRSCIIKFLQDNSHCPECEVVINKTRPNLKLDKTLQDIVYKLVPELYLNEMTRRRRFYAARPATPRAHLSPEQRGDDTERIVFNARDKFSLCLEYISDDSTPGAIVLPHSADPLDAATIISNSNNTAAAAAFVGGAHAKEGGAEGSNMRRYLQCPGMCRIDVLKKFVRNKYNVDTSNYHIDMLHKRVPLPDHYTLIDIAYIYSWKRNAPLKFFFRITDSQQVRDRFDFYDKDAPPPPPPPPVDVEVPIASAASPAPCPLAAVGREKLSKGGKCGEAKAKKAKSVRFHSDVLKSPAKGRGEKPHKHASERHCNGVTMVSARAPTPPPPPDAIDVNRDVWLKRQVMRATKELKRAKHARDRDVKECKDVRDVKESAARGDGGVGTGGTTTTTTTTTTTITTSATTVGASASAVTAAVSAAAAAAPKDISAADVKCASKLNAPHRLNGRPASDKPAVMPAAQANVKSGANASSAGGSAAVAAGVAPPDARRDDIEKEQFLKLVELRAKCSVVGAARAHQGGGSPQQGGCPAPAPSPSPSSSSSPSRRSPKPETPKSPKAGAKRKLAASPPMAAKTPREPKEAVAAKKPKLAMRKQPPPSVKAPRAAAGKVPKVAAKSPKLHAAMPSARPAPPSNGVAAAVLKIPALTGKLVRSPERSVNLEEPNLKSLLNTCKIPSSLSITCVNGGAAERECQIRPVINHIEILKLPEMREAAAPAEKCGGAAEVKPPEARAGAKEEAKPMSKEKLEKVGTTLKLQAAGEPARKEDAREGKKEASELSITITVEKDGKEVLRDEAKPAGVGVHPNLPKILQPAPTGRSINSFQKMFEDTVRKRNELAAAAAAAANAGKGKTAKGAGGGGHDANDRPAKPAEERGGGGKRNILEIASQLYSKKTKLERDAAKEQEAAAAAAVAAAAAMVTNAQGKVAIPRLKTISNLHSNKLALNYSVSISQQQHGGAPSGENVVSSTTRVEVPPVGAPAAGEKARAPPKPKAPTKPPRPCDVLAPKPIAPKGNHRGGGGSPKTVAGGGGPIAMPALSPLSHPQAPLALAKPHAHDKTKAAAAAPSAAKLATKPASTSPPAKLDANQLQEKYNLQNLAQLSASFNFPAAFGHHPHPPPHQAMAAIQQAMLLNFGMQPTRPWFGMPPANVVQYEKFLQSLGAAAPAKAGGGHAGAQSHLLNKEN